MSSAKPTAATSSRPRRPRSQRPLAAGAQEADAFCEDAVNRTVRVYAGAVESVREAGSRGVGLRVFSGGKTGYAYGADLSETGLRDLAEPPPARRAPPIRTSTPESPRMPVRRRSAGSPRTTLARGPWTAASSWRSQSSARPGHGARSSPTWRTPSMPTARGRVALANSAGFRGSYEESQCYAYAYAFAGEGEDLMTGMAVGSRVAPRGSIPMRSASRRPTARSRCTARGSPPAGDARWCSTPTWPRASPR